MSSVDKILPVLDDATVRKTIVSQNLLGEGLFKRCFRIPDMPDFVLAVNKKDFHPNELIKPFVATENKFGDFNLGQTVAYSPSGLIIMKRVYGQPHGVSEWAKKLIAFNNGIPLRVVDAKKFYAQIANVASHKLASYEHLAMQLKKLCEYNVRADINPNNVLVDNERGQFNIIDFEDLNNDNNFDFSKLPRPINGVNDMQCMLVDMSLHIGWLETMPVELRDSFVGNTKIILGKCEDAAKRVGLNMSCDCTKAFVKMLSDTYHLFNAWKHYLAFSNLYKTL